MEAKNLYEDCEVKPFARYLLFVYLIFDRDQQYQGTSKNLYRVYVYTFKDGKYEKHN